MTYVEFIKILETEIYSTEHFDVTVNKIKGKINLVCSSSFDNNLSHEDWFNQVFDEIQWVNLKLSYLAQKYPEQFHSYRHITIEDAKHFDKVFANTKEAPVKKELQSNVKTIVGYVDFIVKSS